MLEDIREIMSSNFIGNGYSCEDLLTVGIARIIFRDLSPRYVARLLRVWQRHASSWPG